MTPTAVADHAAVVAVDIGFEFTADTMSAGASDRMSGSALDPADIGLLARSDEALTIGHWFPIWIPQGLDRDPDLDGYGDISNLPAARIDATLDVPAGAVVVTGAVRVDERPGDPGRVEITEGATGLRDLAVVVLIAARQVQVTAGDVDVVVTAPAGSTELDAVAEFAATSVGLDEALDEGTPTSDPLGDWGSAISTSTTWAGAISGSPTSAWVTWH